MAENDIPSKGEEKCLHGGIDDTKSFSSLSSQGSSDCDSFDSSCQQKKYPIQQLKGNNRRGSPTSVLMNELDEIVASSSSNLNIGKEKAAKEIIEDDNADDNDNPCHNDNSFGLIEDDLTTQGDRTERTCNTEGTFYTGCTDTSGSTKLHQNGVTAMLYKKMRRRGFKGYADSIPSSINTMRPISFDDEIFGNYDENKLIAPSLIDHRKGYHKKIFSKSKLKGYANACNSKSICINGNEEHSALGNESVAEDASYYAGSKSINGFLLGLFSCCELDIVHE